MHSFYRFDGQLLRLEIACLKLAMSYEGLDGGRRRGGGRGVWNSLISKKISPIFSFFKMYAYSLKIIHCSLNEVAIPPAAVRVKLIYPAAG